MEDTVNNYPNKIALTDQTGDTSFHEWQHKGLCIADAIRSKIKNQHNPILVYLPKSSMTLISFVGVLYSGNYYTPTDVRFPFEKANSIIKCLHPKAIITDHKHSEKLINNGIPNELMIYVDDIDFTSQTTDSDYYLNSIIDTDLAYVFFTSGSTGIPKGVSIAQRSIIDYIDWASEEFDIDSETIIGNQAPFYFDNSILDIYLCMKCGSHLHIIPEFYYSFTAKLLDYIIKNNINFLFWVPSALIGIANSRLLERLDCSCIKKVLFCGEVMPNRHLNYWRKYVKADIYANLYGPTEITDVCAFYVVNREFSDDEPLPIGKACKNTQILLLDDNDNVIIDNDIMGELCVRGTCNSVGYYDNEDKTMCSFVQNPLHNHYPEAIYRTGDLAHYNSFGEIMFDGRKDFQIKHKGYRIELGEIETALLSIGNVDNACCVYDNEKSTIVAFCKVSHNINEIEIRKTLTNILPKYMMPARYILLADLPYNNNGKIDRKLLKKEYIEEGQ